MNALNTSIDLTKLKNISGNKRDILISNRDFIIQIFLKAMENEDINKELFTPDILEWFEILVEEFTNMKNPEALTKKLLYIASLYTQRWNRGINTDLIILLLERIFYQLFFDKPYYDYALGFIIYIRLTINGTNENARRRELFHIDTVNKIKSLFANKISNAVTSEDLLSSVKQYIKNCNFTQAYFCLFDIPTIIDVEDNQYPEKCNLVYGIKNEEVYNNIAFPTKDIIEKSILSNGETNDLVFYPLHHGKYHFGYFAGDSKTIYDYEIVNLPQQLINALERLRLAKEIEHKAMEIENLSITDELTGLLNRRGFYAIGSKHYDLTVKNDRKLIVIFGDIDGLKIINDNYGHEAGDTAIKSVADCLQKALRTTDIILRLGGDEFVIMLNREFTTDYVDSIIERIRDEIDTFNKDSDLPFNIIISFGYTVYNNMQQKTFDELLGEADKKLYEEKDIKRVKCIYKYS